MTPDLQTADPSVTSLVTGIVNDAQDLFKQQFTLMRHEIHDDMRRTKDAVLHFALGLGVSVAGSLLLLLALPWMLHWLWPELPLWVAYALVGGALVAVGGTLLCIAVKKFESFNPLPDESFEVLKENVRWITSPK